MPGLRERKKQQTRRLLADTAQRLFAERGFEERSRSPTSRVRRTSRRARSSNYYPTKESLFYEGMVVFEAALVEAGCRFTTGASAVTAFRRVLLDGTERLARDKAATLIAEAARIVVASPALQAREREIVADATEALAAILRDEAGAYEPATAPAVVAHALMGVQRTLVAWVRERVAAGRRGRALAVDAHAQIAAAFDLLEAGLAGSLRGARRERGPLA